MIPLRSILLGPPLDPPLLQCSVGSIPGATAGGTSVGTAAHVPEVSVNNNTEGEGEVSRLVLFHWLPKLHHHAMVEAFRRTWWCSSLTDVDRSMNRHRKVLLGLITFEAWPRWPINSLLVQAFLPRHLPSSTFKALSLSSGRQSCEATVYLNSEEK